MAEIKREPVKIVVGETEYDCFDEYHTLCDIGRWLMSSRADAEEVHRILGELLAESA